MGITAPTSLGTQHDLSSFECTQASLSYWLKKQAMKNQLSGGTRTFVITSTESQQVIGYYSLASGGVDRELAPKSLSRNMPNPIPVIILTRLAVDTGFQKQNLGASLLLDAMKRTIMVSLEVGTSALLVHCLTNEVKTFYYRFGFVESPFNDMTLFLSVKNIKRFFLDVEKG